MKRVYSSVLSRTMLVADPATRSLVSRILATSTYAVGGFVALGTCGVDTSPIIAAMGISGATIGFACKDVGANMVAGLNLAASRPFEHGRTISVGAFKGIVDHWDTRYLYLRGPKGELIHVPNAVVFTSVITVHDPPATAFARDKHGDVVDRHEAAERIKHAVRHAAEEVRGVGSATATAADEPAAVHDPPQAAFEKQLKEERHFAIRAHQEAPQGTVMSSDPRDISIVANDQGEFPVRGPPPYPWNEYFKEMPDMPVTYTLSHGTEYNHAIWLWKKNLQSDKDVLPRFGKHMYSHLKTFSEKFDQDLDIASGKSEHWYKLVAKSLGDQCNEMQSGQDTKWVLMSDKEMEEKGELEYYVAVRNLGVMTAKVMSDAKSHFINTAEKRECKSYWKTMFEHSKRLTQKSYDEYKETGKWPPRSSSIFQDTMEYRDITKHAMPSLENPDELRPVIDSFERMAMCNLEYIIGVMDPASQMVQNVLKHFAKFPKWQEEVYAEIKPIMERVRKQEELTLADWQQCKKFMAFVNETCRYFPLFDIHKRQLTTPTLLADKTFCADGVTVVVNYGAMCKDAKNYPDPGRFDPERFLNWKHDELPPLGSHNFNEENPFEPGKINNPDAFVPWGMGKRMCSGIGWALPAVGLIMMDILSKYKVTYNQPADVTVTYKNSVPSKPTPPIEDFFTFETRVNIAEVANATDKK